jgi:effector-binding domain-containing protein
MAGEPRVVERAAQPYAAISGVVAMDQIPLVADRFPEVFALLAAQGVQPVGAPFLKYDVFHADGRLEIEAAVPVALQGKDVGEIFYASVPAGQYATLTHVGPFDGLMSATETLLRWVGDQGLSLDATEIDDSSERWPARLEIYLTDPLTEPDPSKYVTELAFRLTD